MALGDSIRKQFIDVIQWTEDSDGVLSYRFPIEDAEIQYGARLTVRDSQVAVFVDQGRIADVYGPGLHKLTTANLPILTNLKNWDKLFESPFKSDVYFFSTRLQLNQKWGTAQPITVRDAEFGAVRFRAHGVYAYRVSEPATFHREVSGTRPTYTVSDIEGQLRATVISSMSDAFGESKIPFLDLAANQDELAALVSSRVGPKFSKLGLELNSLQVQNVSLPEEIQMMLDQRIGMTVVGNLNQYAQFQAGKSLPIAAANEGGIAGIGAGLGAGMSIGQLMSQGMSPSATPGTLTATDLVSLLERLHELVKKGVMTQQEFDGKKAELLKRVN